MDTSSERNKGVVARRASSGELRLLFDRAARLIASEEADKEMLSTNTTKCTSAKCNSKQETWIPLEEA